MRQLFFSTLLCRKGLCFPLSWCSPGQLTGCRARLRLLVQAGSEVLRAKTLQGRSIGLLSCAQAPEKAINNQAKVPANIQQAARHTDCSSNNTSRVSQRNTAALPPAWEHQGQSVAQGARPGCQAWPAGLAQGASGTQHILQLSTRTLPCITQTSKKSCFHNSHTSYLKDFVFISLSEMFSCLSDKAWLWFFVRRCQ